MPKTNRKLVCDCGWLGREADLVEAPNPFGTGVVSACPECRMLTGRYKTACESAGCTFVATIGVHGGGTFCQWKG